MTLGSFLITRAGGLMLAAIPLLAHHSFMAEFDQRGPVTLDAIVTKIEWINPHTIFNLDVKQADGKIVNWALQTGSPSALLSRGWTRTSMKPGDHVTVKGYRAKEKANLAAGPWPPSPATAAQYARSVRQALEPECHHTSRLGPGYMKVGYGSRFGIPRFEIRGIIRSC